MFAAGAHKLAKADLTEQFADAHDDRLMEFKHYYAVLKDKERRADRQAQIDIAASAIFTGAALALDLLEEIRTLKRNA